MTLTPEQIAEYQRLRALKYGYEKIASIMGISPYYLRCGIDSAHKAKVLAVAKAAKKKDKARYAQRATPIQNTRSEAVLGHMGGRLLDIPREVLIDREFRHTLSHPSFTAAFFGDPLPGRSALDQIMGRRPLYERLKK